jgi:hypothetical protein
MFCRRDVVRDSELVLQACSKRVGSPINALARKDGIGVVHAVASLVTGGRQRVWSDARVYNIVVVAGSETVLSHVQRYVCCLLHHRRHFCCRNYEARRVGSAGITDSRSIVSDKTLLVVKFGTMVRDSTGPGVYSTSGRSLIKLKSIHQTDRVMF